MPKHPPSKRPWRASLKRRPTGAGAGAAAIAGVGQLYATILLANTITTRYRPQARRRIVWVPSRRCGYSVDVLGPGMHHT